jgi:isopentenyldiphosphate isomerase
MKIKHLLLKLLPGILPLFIFIIADELWGIRIGLIAAIVVGVFELLILWVKERRFDKFILFDTLLIVSLGGVSLILDNDVFFKLKPAIIGVITCLLLGVSVFTPNNFILMMSKRYVKDISFTEEQYKQLQNSLRVMFFIFLIHTILIFYSVWFMSKEAWAFISGGLFYILMGVYFLYEMGTKYLKTKKFRKEEWLPVVDNDGNVLGKATREECHSGKMLMHPVVHLHVFNEKGELFLQKRAKNKLIQPNMWDTAVGGHISINETIEESLKREALEEIGIKDFEPKLLLKYKWQTDVETELVFCFVTKYAGKIKIDKTELADGKFWTIDEINNSLEKGVMTPNFEHEFRKILSKII